MELSGGVAYTSLSSEEKAALGSGETPKQIAIHVFCKACDAKQRGVHAQVPHVCGISRRSKQKVNHLVQIYTAQTGADIRAWGEIVATKGAQPSELALSTRRSRRKRKHVELFVSHEAASKTKTKAGAIANAPTRSAAGNGVLHCLDTMLNYGPREPSLFTRKWQPMLTEWVHSWPELLRLYLCERLNVNPVDSGPQQSGLGRCQFLFDVLLTKKFARPFLRPVDPSRYSDYLQYVSEPLHLLAIKERLQAQAYSSHTEFATDVRRVALNCMLYNAEGSSYYVKAEQMLTWFTSAYKDLVCSTRPFVDSNPVGSEIGKLETPDEACSTAIERVRTQLAKELGLSTPEMPIIISMQRVMTPSSVLKLYVKVQFSAHPQGSLTHVCLTKDYSLSSSVGFKLHHVQEGKLLSDVFTTSEVNQNESQDVEESARGLGSYVPPNLRFQLFMQTRAQLAEALDTMGTLEFRDWPLAIRVNALAWLCNEACTLPIIREFLQSNDGPPSSDAESQWYSRQRLRFQPLGVDANGREHWALQDPQGLNVPRVLYVRVEDNSESPADHSTIAGSASGGWRSFSGPDTIRMYARSLDHTTCLKQKRLRKTLFERFPDSRKVFEPRGVHKRRSPETVLQDLLDLEVLLCHGSALNWRSRADVDKLALIDAENSRLFSSKDNQVNTAARENASNPPRSPWRDWSVIREGWCLSLTRAMPLDYSRGKSTQPKLYDLKGAALVHVELRILWPNDGKWSVRVGMFSASLLYAV